MRFLKNSFAAVLIICTLASCSIAFAATPSSENSLGMSPQAQENFSKAPYKVQEEILSSLICSQGGISPRLRIPSLKPPLSPSPSHWH